MLTTQFRLHVFVPMLALSQIAAQTTLQVPVLRHPTRSQEFCDSATDCCPAISPG